MFLSRNKNNNVYPCKPQFYYIKVGFKGPTLYRHVFVMGLARCGKGAFVAFFFKEAASGRSTLGWNVCCESLSIQNLLVHGTQ